LKAKKIQPLKFTFAIIICLLFITCKKFPEGGHPFGLRDIETRIHGEWRIIGFTVNGIDSISHMKANADFCSDYQLSFARHDIEGNVMTSPCVQFGNNYYGVTEDKMQLKLVYRFSPDAATLYPIQLNEYKTVFWTIERFAGHEFWLKTNLNGKEYEVKMVKYDQFD
jgi:hypothetical protein